MMENNEVFIKKEHIKTQSKKKGIPEKWDRDPRVGPRTYNSGVGPRTCDPGVGPCGRTIG